MPHATDELGAVDLEVHAGRAAMAVAATGQLDRDQVGGDVEACREPLDGGDERRPMGLPGGQQSQAHVKAIRSEEVSVTAAGGPALDPLTARCRTAGSALLLRGSGASQAG